MSEFKVECVRIGEIIKHPNADSLSITNIHGGYPCIFKTGDFNTNELAVYIPVDSLVPVARPEFKFLDGGKGREFERIKARKLRGTFSMGLLVRAPVGAREGDDLQATFGIDKWLPESEREPAQPNRVKKKVSLAVRVWFWFLRLIGLAPPKAPSVPVYDIEGIRKHSGVLVEGEEVIVREKIHGMNSKFLHTGKRFYVGSRTQFRKGPSAWHTIAERHNLEQKLRNYPNIVLFGEVFGECQDLKYGVPPSEGVRFVAFDALVMNADGTRKWLSNNDLESFCFGLDIPMAPVLYRGPWKPEMVSLAEGRSVIPGANHCREGMVIRPVIERTDLRIGRVQLKLAGEMYLTRKEQP